MTISTFILISYTYSGFVLSVALTILFIILPKIVQEGNIRNGLISFRRLLLVSGVSIFLLTLTALIIIVGRFLIPIQFYIYLSPILIMVFSTIVLITAFTKNKIYTFSFSKESKEHHRKKAIKEKTK